MKAKHLNNQSKTKFENLLFDLNGEKQTSHRKHHDVNHEENTHQIVYLYYNDQGHIGTWTKRKCWIYPDHLGDKA